MIFFCSQKVHKIISTQRLTWLIIGVILRLEQRRGTKEVVPEGAGGKQRAPGMTAHRFRFGVQGNVVYERRTRTPVQAGGKGPADNDEAACVRKDKVEGSKVDPPANCRRSDVLC